jgi:hypothetical protein
MRARLEIERKGKIVSDSIWKDRKQFAQNSVRGHAADKIRLDIELESAADIVALIDWCNMSHLCFKK